MEDRYNRCDVCGKDIVLREWSQERGRSVPTGQREIDTPEVLIPPRSRLGADGKIHAACLPKLVLAQQGAGI